MTDRYDPAKIEPKWQNYWEADQTFRTPEDTTGPKAYILDMFPYPSGAGLHVGHPEGYTATDIMARFLRHKGHAVLHPMGWDAFGLPAEQHAVRTGTHPRDTTVSNIDNFRRQLKLLGFSYDWSREIDTTDPSYVRWTQWIFLQLFKHRLAYQTEIPVNWCPELGTVLANEEVKDGLSEIGSHPVQELPLRQWMLKITAYAEQLLAGLELTAWPESTRTMQREWIGRSEGASIRFALASDDDEQIEAFTTRPDTLFGATFLVLAPEHPLLDNATQPGSDLAPDQRERLQNYRDAVARKSHEERRTGRSKEGVFTGLHARHPIEGTEIPIWTAEYVLAGYGTGAIMAVPAHDERDFEFAQEHDLPIRQVVRPADQARGQPAPGQLEQAFVGEGVSMNSGALSDLPTAECKQRVIAELERLGSGTRRVQYKLRDWVFSRQRYWGEPIPIYFPVATDGDPRAGADYTIDYTQPIAVEESELPLLLPELDDFRPGNDPAGALARATDWRFFQRDGQWYARETNTMPQWAGSCWYYLRFTDPHNDEAGWSADAVKRWLPVDLYVGGAEHAVLHLLYARFWHHVLFDQGLVPTEEPFRKLVHQGMILGEVEFTGFVDAQGRVVSRELVQVIDGEPTRIDSGETLRAERIEEERVIKDKQGHFVLKDQPEVQVEGRAHKMSKSRGNVINPDVIIEEFGADAMRLYEMFLGPLEATKPWSTHGIHGVRRFLDRAYALLARTRGDARPSEELTRHMHKTIRKVTADIEHLRFNTAISAMMVFVTALTACDPVPASAVEVLTRLLHPFAPHLAEEMWARLGHAPSVQSAPWPEFDPALCVENEVEVPVQINGKVRAKATLAREATQEQALAAARAIDKVAELLEGKTIKRVIWVPGKILNLICGG